MNLAFCLLPLADGSTIYINTNYVLSVRNAVGTWGEQPGNDVSAVRLLDSAEELWVAGNPDQVVSLLLGQPTSL